MKCNFEVEITELPEDQKICTCGGEYIVPVTLNKKKVN